jgi:hypothetical protein
MQPALRHIGGKWWQLVEPLRFNLMTGEVVTVPAGMVTDLSSVPRFLWGAFPPYNDALGAYILHDWMYITDYRQDELGDRLGRKMADNEMLRQAQLLNPQGWLDNWLRWLAVRMFGWYLYRRRADKLKKRNQ